MDNRPRHAIADAYAEAWRLKGPLLAAHVATIAVFFALLSPLLALAMRTALAVSGQPALTDKDIAMFVLSPAGAVAILGVAALFLAVQVIGIAVKMAVLSAEHGGRDAGPGAALRLVAGQAPRIVAFAARLVLRVLAFVVPAALIAGAAALLLLGDYDINFYLAERPPEFLMTLAAAAVALGGMAALLLPRLLSWAVALPLVMFAGVGPRQSFARSTRDMAGRRIGLAWRLALWAAVALGLGVAGALLAGTLARAAAVLAGEDLSRLAPLLLALALGLGVLNALLAALSSGALAHLLLDEAGWPQDRSARAAPAVERRAPLIAALVAAGVLAALGLSALAAPPVTAPDDIVVIAHRGGAIARPENTIPAMEKGIEDGADWLEIDVQETAEGEVIVAHDSDFMKQAGVPTKVWEVTAADLEGIDIGAWFDPAYAGTPVPRLSEVLALAKDRTQVMIELKYYGHDVALPEKVAAEVEAAGMTGQVAAMSLSPPQAARMKAVRPDWQVGLLAATAIGRLDRIEADFLAVNAAIATPRLIRRAEAAGKPVYVWTMNDASGMARMAILGVSGLITDRPALARAVLEDLAALSPPERVVLTLAHRLGLTGRIESGGDAP